MKRIIMLCIATLLGTLFVKADEISFSDIDFLQDETTANIGIDLTNQNTQYVSFQMDVYLPEGITLCPSGNSLTGRFADDGQELVIGKQDDGAYRLTSTSFSLTPITGTSGRLLTLSVAVSDGFVSGTIYVRNVRFATANSERVVMNDISLPISFSVARFTVDDKSRMYGESNPTFTYTVTEGELAGSPALSTTATKTSPVGTYDIVAARGTITGRYEATNGTLTITKAPLTVTANSFTMKQGDALPDFTASYSGFKNSETAAVLSTLPTFTCAATSSSTPGTYDISASGGSALNYALNYVKGTLTITEADPVAVTARSYTIQYGDAIPSFEYDVEGNLVGTPALSCSATVNSPVGTYPILVTKGDVSSYNVTYVAGILTITPAPVKVTAKSYSIQRGDPLPDFEATYSGFKNGETAEVLTKQPTFQCAATPNSKEGTYDIVVGGAEAENYTFSYTKGVLTITDADTTVISSDNVLYINNVEGFVGQQLTLSVKMKNTVGIQTVQFDLCLPEGVTVAKDEEGFDLIELSTERTTAKKMDSFSSSQVSGGSYRVLINSNRGYTFDGEDGEIALVTVSIDPEMQEGDYPIYLKDIVLVNTSSEGYETECVKSTLTVSAYSPGDVNDDGKVNAIDLNAIVNYILEHRNFPFAFVEKAADLNADGKINAIDVNAVTNMILRGDAPQNSKKPASLWVGELEER